MAQDGVRPQDVEEPISSTVRLRGGREGTDETHPAFGVVIVTRRSGTSRALFQSDVLHDQTIALSIQTAERGRDLSHDWVFARKELIEVEMSLAQWGALVSSIGIGSGVPVTIRRTENVTHVPNLPYQPRIKENLDEVHASIGKVLERARESLEVLKDAIEEKKGVRAIREALRTHDLAVGGAERNADFAVKSMVSAGEKITSQVRADIESQILAATRIVNNQAEISPPKMDFGALETLVDPETQADRSNINADPGEISQ